MESERMATLEAQMKELMGADGRKGRVEKIEDRQDVHSKLIYIGFGIVVAMQVLAANGWLKIH